MQSDGSLVLAGSTSEDWDGENAGGTDDFAVVALDGDGDELWRWQVRFEAVAYRVLECPVARKLCVLRDVFVVLPNAAGFPKPSSFMVRLPARALPDLWRVEVSTRLFVGRCVPLARA